VGANCYCSLGSRAAGGVGGCVCASTASERASAPRCVLFQLLLVPRDESNNIYRVGEPERPRKAPASDISRARRTTGCVISRAQALAAISHQKALARVLSVHNNTLRKHIQSHREYIYVCMPHARYTQKQPSNLEITFAGWKLMQILMLLLFVISNVCHT
jgi:hypothetical protein